MDINETRIHDIGKPYSIQSTRLLTLHAHTNYPVACIRGDKTLQPIPPFASFDALKRWNGGKVKSTPLPRLQFRLSGAAKHLGSGNGVSLPAVNRWKPPSGECDPRKQPVVPVGNGPGRGQVHSRTLISHFEFTSLDERVAVRSRRN